MLALVASLSPEVDIRLVQGNLFAVEGCDFYLEPRLEDEEKVLTMLVGYGVDVRTLSSSKIGADFLDQVHWLMELGVVSVDVFWNGAMVCHIDHCPGCIYEPFALPTQDALFLHEQVALTMVNDQINVSAIGYKWRLTGPTELISKTCNFFSRPRLAKEFLEAESSSEKRAMLSWTLATLITLHVVVTQNTSGPGAWLPFEREFHARTRVGLSRVRGATYPMKGKRLPLPAFKSHEATNVIQLPLPSVGTINHTLRQVLQARRSCRRYSSAPTLFSLGELLAYSAKIKSIEEVDGEQLSKRPYPSGGGCYELEIYVLANGDKDLPAGLYHYDAMNHILSNLLARDLCVRMMFTTATRAMGATPPMLLIFSTRINKLAWKYQDVAYALTLKHVGVLSQTISLVATDLGLGSCILGTGNSLAFAMATGISIDEETSVGEMAIGVPA